MSIEGNNDDDDDDDDDDDGSRVSPPPLFLTVPVSNCEGERSFSVLKQVKKYPGRLESPGVSKMS